MTAFRQIPFRFDDTKFRTTIRLERCPECTGSVEQLLRRALPLVKPKALFRVSYINARSDATVDIDGVRFISRVMSRNLREVERVFPYVATCGNELAELECSCTDLLALFWLDTLKDMALAAALEFLQDRLKESFGLEQLSSMNPGSGNTDLWAITQQKPLFGLLGDVEAMIGVRLTPSCLMLPNKSVSGVFYPTEVRFESCQLCTRENCPRRRAAYAGQEVPVPEQPRRATATAAGQEAAGALEVARP